MRKIPYISIFILLISSSLAFGQETDRLRMTEDQAKTILAETLSDSTLHNVIGKKRIIKEEEKAVQFAEMVLFNFYDKEKIQTQQPYDIFEIDGYWIISGTLPKKMRGGTFMIIIDSRNYQVIKLTHGR